MIFLRWALFIPLSLISAALALLFLKFIDFIILNISNPFSISYSDVLSYQDSSAINLFFSFVFTSVFIIAGTMIAPPTNKTKARKILLIIGLIAVSIALIEHLSLGAYLIYTDSYLLIIDDIFLYLGLIVGFYKSNVKQ